MTQPATKALHGQIVGYVEISARGILLHSTKSHSQAQGYWLSTCNEHGTHIARQWHSTKKGLLQEITRQKKNGAVTAITAWNVQNTWLLVTDRIVGRPHSWLRHESIGAHFH